MKTNLRYRLVAGACVLAGGLFAPAVAGAEVIPTNAFYGPISAGDNYGKICQTKVSLGRNSAGQLWIIGTSPSALCKLQVQVDCNDANFAVPKIAFSIGYRSVGVTQTRLCLNSTMRWSTSLQQSNGSWRSTGGYTTGIINGTLYYNSY